MFQPEIATTWLTPAVVNAAATSRSTRSRSPMRIPAASPASGSGRTRGERVAGAAPETLQASDRLVASAGHLEAVAVEGAPRADPLEVGAVRRVRVAAAVRPSTTDDVARLDRRVAGQRRRDAERPRSRRRVEAQRRDLLAVARRPDRLDDHRPRSATVGRLGARAGPPAASEQAQGDGHRADRRPADQPPPRGRQEEPRSIRSRRDAAPTAASRDPGRWPSASGQGGDRRTDRQPAAAGHVSDTVTSSRSRSNVFSPRTPARPQLVDRRERGLVAGREDLLGRDRPDARQRVELLERRRVQVDEVAAGATGPRPTPPPAPTRVVTRRDDGPGRRRRGPSPGSGRSPPARCRRAGR